MAIKDEEELVGTLLGFFATINMFATEKRAHGRASLFDFDDPSTGIQTRTHSRPTIHYQPRIIREAA
jgi:hypothetical protein